MPRKVNCRKACKIAATLLLSSWTAVAVSASQTAQTQDQSTAAYGLTTNAVHWAVEFADGQRREVNGQRAVGVSLHATNRAEPRPVRILLMPVPDRQGQQDRTPKLDIGSFRAHTNAGEYVGIDLRTGAALVDLGPATERQQAEPEQAPPQSGDGPGPTDVRLGFFPFWPMIITHSIVAGAEGTRILIISDADAAGQPRTIFSLIEGNAATIDWQDNPAQAITLTPGRPVRVVRDGDRGRAIDLTREERHAFDQIRHALTTGWSTAFPDGDR